MRKLTACREILRFAIQQRSSGFQIGDRPWLDEESGELFLRMITDSRSYLEYGSGGSTVLAASLNKPFVSVDTDRYLIAAVRRKIGELASNQHLEHANIGWTKIHGYPVVKWPYAITRKRWKAYVEKPWRCVDNNLLPDLVLIDGRFRAAAALTSCVHLAGSPNCRILVDDYVMRPHYHVIADYAELLEVKGRMAIFRPPAKCPAGIRQAIDQYSSDCR